MIYNILGCELKKLDHCHKLKIAKLQASKGLLSIKGSVIGQVIRYCWQQPGDVSYNPISPQYFCKIEDFS